MTQRESDILTPKEYSSETSCYWPMPATDENKMVCQLDDVTKESEAKASEIFDNIEAVSNEIVQNQESLQNIISFFGANVRFFAALHKKFPEVKAFGRQLEINDRAVQNAAEIDEILQNINFDLMNVIDMMQYQDIHRQKIERVINVMRSLSTYMNTLFEGRFDDAKRVSSAQHIAGDKHNQLASNEEIEELLAQFGK